MKIRPLLNVNWKDNILEKIENTFSTIQSREIPISSDVTNKIPIEIILQTSQLKQIFKKIKLAKSKKMLAFEEDDKL